MGIGSLISRLVGGGAATASHDELKAAAATGSATIIDVRERNEFAGGHIPGALNLPLSAFDPAAVPAGKPAILICLSGARSGRAAAECARAGRGDVRNFSGGMAVWRLQGGAVTR